MTLFQALAKSQELDCPVVNRKAGLKITHKSVRDFYVWDLPEDGWDLDDSPVPISFDAEYIGCDLMSNLVGEMVGTVYSFKGRHVTTMPVGTKVKVTLEPIS